MSDYNLTVFVNERFKLAVYFGLGLMVDEMMLPMYLFGYSQFTYWSFWGVSLVAAGVMVVMVVILMFGMLR